MASRNNTLEDLSRTLENLVKRAHYSTRQTRDGSDLNSKGIVDAITSGCKEVKEEFGKFLSAKEKEYNNAVNILNEINSKTGSTAKQKEKQYRKELTDGYKQEQYDAARGAGYSKREAKKYASIRAKEFDARLKEQNEKVIRTFKEYSNTIYDATSKLKQNLNDARKVVRKDKFNSAVNAVTFGLQGRAQERMDNISTYANALEGISSRFGAMSRLASIKGKGGIASKGVGVLGKAAGVASKGLLKLVPIVGWISAAVDVACAALKTFGKALNAINDYEIQQLEFDKEAYKAELDLKTKNLELGNQREIENIDYRYELLKRNIEVESNIAKEARQISADNYVQSVKTSIGSITDGIAKTAFESANAALDASTSFTTLSRKAETERAKEAATNAARAIKHDATLENIAQEEISANLSYENTTAEIAQKRSHHKDKHYIVSNIQDVTGGAGLYLDDLMTMGNGPVDVNGVSQSKARYDRQENKGILEAGGSIIVNGIKDITGAQESTHQLLESNLNYIHMQTEGSQSLNKLAIKNENEQNVLRANNEAEIYNLRKDYAQSEFEINQKAANEIAKAYLGLAQKEFEIFGKFDKTIRTTAIGVGILTENGIKSYTENMTQRIPNMLRKWGKSFEDVLKMQQDYGMATGRSINLSDNDIENSFGLTMLTGDQHVTDELNADMQIFTLSVADSSQMFAEILDDSRKIGLDMRKMGKNLVRDMKLANRYEFKGGVKALAKMSEWATKVRFDMTNLPNLIDKYTNSLEDSIKNAASTQVLGGNFAMHMGDPLKNSFLGFMDPAQLAKNQNDALRGIGYFDSKEGKTKIGIADQIRLKAYSEATGIDIENLRAQITQQVQGDEVMRNLNSEAKQTYTNKQKELLQQQAHRTQDGRWVVTLNNGEERDINELSKTDFSELLPTEEAMVDLAKQGVGYLKQLVDKESLLAGETNAEQIELFQKHVQVYYDAYEGMLAQAQKNFTERKEEYGRLIQENLDFVVSTYEGYCERAKSGDDAIDAQMKEIKSKAKAIVSTLEDVNQMFIEAKARMNNEDVAPRAALASRLSSSVETRQYVAEADSTSVRNIRPELYSYSPRVNDGIILKGGEATRIDDNDQVLAAKDGGPIDKMLSTINDVMPRPMQYDSYVRENPYNGGGNQSGSDGKIEVAPIQININGNIQLSGSNGTIDITQQIANDPNFIRSLSQMISLEVEKKVRGGRVNSPLNRGLEF